MKDRAAQFTAKQEVFSFFFRCDDLDQKKVRGIKLWLPQDGSEMGSLCTTTPHRRGAICKEKLGMTHSQEDNTGYTSYIDIHKHFYESMESEPTGVFWFAIFGREQ